MTELLCITMDGELLVLGLHTSFYQYITHIEAMGKWLIGDKGNLIH